ncbi:MAG: DUF4276 family protein [Pirellulales bacterium]|nr:DUF4276 family protein [Pirellulales bacterium]
MSLDSEKLVVEDTLVLNLCCIVEGKGEVGAVRVLMERLSTESAGKFWVNLVKTPLRTNKYRLIKRDDDTELAKKIRLAVLNLRDCSSPKGILILIDADDDCPAELGPELLCRARGVRSDVPITVVLAKGEFEAWFLAGIEGLRGKHGFPPELPVFENAESVRDAKGKLSELLVSNHVYKPTADQASVTSVFDLSTARERSPSFQKLCRALEGLVR